MSECAEYFGHVALQHIVTIATGHNVGARIAFEVIDKRRSDNVVIAGQPMPKFVNHLPRVGLAEAIVVVQQAIDINDTTGINNFRTNTEALALTGSDKPAMIAGIMRIHPTLA